LPSGSIVTTWWGGRGPILHVALSLFHRKDDGQYNPPIPILALTDVAGRLNPAPFVVRTSLPDLPRRRRVGLQLAKWALGKKRSAQSGSTDIPDSATATLVGRSGRGADLVRNILRTDRSRFWHRLTSEMVSSFGKPACLRPYWRNGAVIKRFPKENTMR
jgi:hypothetical protein